MHKQCNQCDNKYRSFYFKDNDSEICKLCTTKNGIINDERFSIKEYHKNYMKEYYINNKQKFLKKREGNRTTGQRGEGKKKKYEFSKDGAKTQYTNIKKLAKEQKLSLSTIYKIIGNEKTKHDNIFITKL